MSTSPQTIEVRPHEGGQMEYFTRTEYEVLFGGEAGPGKTWALVVDALGLQYQFTELGKPAVYVPEYRAVLFRRKSTQLSKLIDECKKYYPSRFGAVYAAQKRGEPGPSFTFPSGAVIFLCHMQHEDDKENHQGIEYQFAGFDELTHFTVTQYTYIFSRLRTTVEYLTCRMRATTNPTGSGLFWVKKRFIRNGSHAMVPGNTYWFKPPKDIESDPCGIPAEPGEEYAQSRTFIPGDIDENKSLKNPEAYKDGIRQMGERYAKALLGGDWDAFGGDFFEDFSNSMGVAPFKIPEEWQLIGSIDPGWSSPCAFGLHARDFEGNIYTLFTYYVKGRSAKQHAKAIDEMIVGFDWTNGRHPDEIVSGTDAFARKDRHAIMDNDLTWADVFEAHGLPLIRARTERVLGWWTLKDLMREKKWFYFEGYNDNLIEELVAAEADDKNPEDISGYGNDPSVMDHALDMLRYGIRALHKPVEKPKEEENKPPSWAGMLDLETEDTDIRKIW